MLTPVFPLRMVLFQGLLLLVAIALEAVVLRRSLRLPYRISMEYAASMNLLAVGIGWIIFFGLDPLLPDALREQIMGYILFNQFAPNDWIASMPIWIIVAGMVAFFVTFFIKYEGLELLLVLLSRRDPRVPDAVRRRPRDRRNRQAEAAHRPPTRQRANAVLRANALSFSAVVLLLVLRAVFQQAG